MKFVSLLKFLIIPTLLVSSLSTYAQRTCGSVEHMQTLMQDVHYAHEYQERKLKFEAFNAANQTRSACANPVILPMAIHYQGISNPNMSCLIEMAERQVQILNDDYSGENADINLWTNGASSNFPGVSNGETCVQFCLGTQNHPPGAGLTEGQPAITFNQSNGDSYPAFSGYINIFVRNINGQVLGYSPLGGQGNGDGVTINTFAFSNSPGCSGVNPGAPYNEGRTLTHELGHYLFLNHIWGDGGCSVDDGIADTPLQGGASGGCPASSQSSCGSRDMHMNYMDYTNDACMYMFSAGQSNRMENYVAQALQNVSNNYATVCQVTPQAPIASFNASSTNGCAPLAVTFTDNSGNSPTSWSWSFPGGTPSSSTSQNPTVTYNNPGDYTATLTASNAQGSNGTSQSVTAIDCSSISCITLNHLNGGSPTLIINDATGQAAGGYISGHNGFGDIAKAEYFDDYGAYTDINGVEFDFGLASGSGNLEFVIWSDNNGTPGSELATQSISISTIAADVSANSNTFVDFGGIVSITGPFYIGFKLDYSDGSEIAVNTNSNGETNPTTAWEQWGDNSWHSFNDGTNNTWEIDVALAIYPDVCTSSSVSVNDINGLTNMKSYPNPATNEFTIEFSTEYSMDIEFDIFDAFGRKVLVGGNSTINGQFNKSFDVSKLSTGTYFVRMTNGNDAETIKFLKL